MLIQTLSESKPINLENAELITFSPFYILLVLTVCVLDKYSYALVLRTILLYT